MPFPLLMFACFIETNVPNIRFVETQVAFIFDCFFFGFVFVFMVHVSAFLFYIGFVFSMFFFCFCCASCFAFRLQKNIVFLAILVLLSYVG